MKILCILSSNKGHIDFGGMGFLKLAKSLAFYGNEILWLTTKVHSEQLTKNGFNVVDTTVDALHLHPFYSIADVSQHHQYFLECVSYMKELSNRIVSYKPDVILVDRILPLSSIIFEQLQIPWVSVGTPGGYWKIQKSGVFQQQEAIVAYQEVGELFARSCGWQGGTLTSLWANSPYLNICFMGRDFYLIENKCVNNTAYVYHFEAHAIDKHRDRFGISFGNTGFVDKLMPVLRSLESSTITNSALEVFSGEQASLYNNLKFSYENRINLHKWVKFSDHMPLLIGMAFFGGIGTLWECINHDIPMLVVPGDVGDQQFNGLAVERLALGKCLAPNTSEHEIEQKVSKILSLTCYQDNIRAFKQDKHYTDTLETIVSKIQDLIH